MTRTMAHYALITGFIWLCVAILFDVRPVMWGSLVFMLAVALLMPDDDGTT